MVYGAVSPEAARDMNRVFHGPTDYVVFNDATRKLGDSMDYFLLTGAFNKSDPARWRVDDKLQLLPPQRVQDITAGVVVPWPRR
jgi:hypothetical protein